MKNSTLTDVLLTREDADNLLVELDTWRDSLASNAQLPTALKSQIQTVLRENNINTDNRTELIEFITALKDSIKNLPVINLTLAVDLPEDRLAEFAYWINQQIGEHILIDIQKDETIIAGAIIRYRGYYKDYSFKNKLDEVVSTQPGS